MSRALVSLYSHSEGFLLLEEASSAGGQQCLDTMPLRSGSPQAHFGYASAAFFLLRPMDSATSQGFDVRRDVIRTAAMSLDQVALESRQRRIMNWPDQDDAIVQ